MPGDVSDSVAGICWEDKVPLGFYLMSAKCQHEHSSSNILPKVILLLTKHGDLFRTNWLIYCSCIVQQFWLFGSTNATTACRKTPSGLQLLLRCIIKSVLLVPGNSTAKDLYYYKTLQATSQLLQMSSRLKIHAEIKGNDAFMHTHEDGTKSVPVH